MGAEMSEAVAAMISEAAKAREQLHRDRKTAAAKIRQEKAERRKRGLVARHTAKLARRPAV